MSDCPNCGAPLREGDWGYLCGGDLDTDGAMGVACNYIGGLQAERDKLQQELYDLHHSDEVCPRVQCQGAYKRLEAERDKWKKATKYLWGWVDADEYCDRHRPDFAVVSGEGECDNPDCEWCRNHRWITEALEATND